MTLNVLTLAGLVCDRLAADTGVMDIRPAPGILRPLDLAGEREMQRPMTLCVLPGAEQPGRRTGDDEDGPGQRLTLTVRVLCIAATRNTRGGGDAIMSLDKARTATRQALAGWVPVGALEPLRYAGGRLTEIAELRQGRAWWQDDYTVSQWLPYSEC